MRNHGMKGGLWKLIMHQCSSEDSSTNTFGRLFPAENNQPNRQQLLELSRTMKESDPKGDADTPIGFAFLGQFIDHDITLDATTQLGKVAGDVSKIENLRTPRLELDSIYLDGPEGSPYLYHEEEEGKIKLIHGLPYNPCDLQRNRFGTAIIGDPRNDENIFISQLHGLFIRLHNYFIDEGKDFEEARQLVRWTYQWIIVNEFLPAIISPTLLNTFIEGLMNHKLPITGVVDWAKAPSMPVEFSAAAYRFGHSHVRQDYRVNIDTSGSLFDPRFGAFGPIDAAHNIDWIFFFDIDGKSFLRAKPIDTRLALDLFALPFIDEGRSDDSNLAFRNLNRGQLVFNLPYGEQIAKDLGIKDSIATPKIIKELELPGTPLWFYILAEAEQSGGKLDKVGGTIVTATLLQMLLDDDESYIKVKPDFNPLADYYGQSVFAKIVHALSPCGSEVAA